MQAQTDRTNILTQMEAIVPVSAMNTMVIRGMNIILLMSSAVAQMCALAV